MNVFLTGATGFLGSAIADRISHHDNLKLTCAVRRAASVAHGDEVLVGGLNADTDWSTALINQQVVIHAAARAHVIREESADPLAEYRKVNVEGTLNLARKAVEAGVKRFVFISSIKVNGEQTSIGKACTADDVPAPEDPYGISKHEAEQNLRQVAATSDMELVIIRPPLVYGPGVKGNFARMVRLVKEGLPLPFGAVHNKRSLVSLENLIDLIITCIAHPAAVNQVFLASDGHDLSTTELLRALAKAMDCPSRLIPVPAKVLELGARLLGREAIAQRLLGSLQVDISKTRELLGWEPPVSVEEGLRRCVSAPAS